jgi:L-cysteine desulfidase
MRFSRNKFRYAKRRCGNAADAIKRDRFVESFLSGDKDLLNELRKFKGSPQNVASKIDGHTDPVQIADHLKGLFENLYNRTGTQEPLKNLMDEVDASVTVDDLEIVDKITPELIKLIIKEKIKPNKTDPVQKPH